MPASSSSVPRYVILFLFTALMAGALLAQPVVEIQLYESSDPDAMFITWSPAPARARLQVPQADPVTVVLRNRQPVVQGAGQVRFGMVAIEDGQAPSRSTLELTLPADGSWVSFFVAGRWGFASENRDDTIIEATDKNSGVLLGSRSLMVRIRKNANKLKAHERDRFINALVKFNRTPTYDLYQDIHSRVSDGLANQGHRVPAFLVWHRVFILAFERELQKIDPSVALPYWKSDEAAPNIFHADFMGVTDPNTTEARFNNELSTWRSNGAAGIRRRPMFHPSVSPAALAQNPQFNIAMDDTVVAVSQSFTRFREMEENPHDLAHVYGGGVDRQTGNPIGWLANPATAVMDPLFFLLHANIDRVWAYWQRVNERFDPAVEDTYAPQGQFVQGAPLGPGNFILDTMWPWNGDVNPPRPPLAPGGSFGSVGRLPNSPPAQPRPIDAIDYRTNTASISGLGYAYDDLPFN